MKTKTLGIGIEPEVVQAVADLVMEIAFDIGIEDDVERYGLFLRPEAFVRCKPASIYLCPPYTTGLRRFVKICVHEIVHIRRIVQGKSLGSPVGNQSKATWTHPEETETELETRELVTRLSPAVNLAAVKLAGVLWARRRRQEELLASYRAKGS